MFYRKDVMQEHHRRHGVGEGARLHFGLCLVSSVFGKGSIGENCHLIWNVYFLNFLKKKTGVDQI